MTVDALAQKLDARRSGDGWSAKCPAHDDRRASLSISEGKDGRVLLHCFAGCACDEILSAVGLTKRDLFPRRASGNQERLGRIVATYDYVDENGKLLFQSVRYVPKDFRQRRPDGRGGWIWNLREVRLVLYRLPDVLASQTVVVTEGEKDADRMTALGFTATTNPLGAGKWCDDYSDTLRGKDVVIFRDNDEQGEKHVAQVIGSLRGKARSIKLVILLDGFHDVSDYIASLPKKERKAAIQNLIDATPLWNFVDVDANAIELPPAPARLPMARAKPTSRCLFATPIKPFLNGASGKPNQSSSPPARISILPRKGKSPATQNSTAYFQRQTITNVIGAKARGQKPALTSKPPRRICRNWKPLPSERAQKQFNTAASTKNLQAVRARPYSRNRMRRTWTSRPQLPSLLREECDIFGRDTTCASTRQGAHCRFDSR
jgi:5S rRNA maturation endonuclease (ribonuclease M5)